MALKITRQAWAFALLFFAFSKPCLAQDQCPQVLSQPEEIALLSEVSKLNENFLHGFLTERQLREKLQIQIAQMLRLTPPKLQESKRKEINGVIELHNKMALAQLKQDLLLKYLKGLGFDQKDRHALQKLGLKISVLKKFIAEQAVLVRPFYIYLTEVKGAQWDSERGWDFSSLSGLNARKIWEDPWLPASLFLFASPGVVMGIANSDRSVAIPVDQTVFLPPVKIGPDEARVQVKRLDKYQSEVKEHLEKFSSELETFLKASQAANEALSSYTGMIKFHWFDSDDVKTQEIERDRAYDRMRWHFNTLKKDYGAPKDVTEFMLVQMIQANFLEKKQIQNTLNELDGKETAFYAASAVVLALYLAPLIGPVMEAIVTRTGFRAVGQIFLRGGVSGATQLSWSALRTLGVRNLIGTIPWALPGQSAAAVFGYVLPLSFGLLTAGLHSAVDANYGYGNFWCNFEKNSSRTLPEAVAGGGWFAFIPAGGAAIQAFTTGLSGVAELGTIAKASYQLLVGTVLTALMVRNGTQSYTRSNKIAHEAKKVAEDPGRGDEVNALSAQALKERLDSGVDFAFALSGSVETIKAGWKNAGRYRQAQESKVESVTVSPTANETRTASAPAVRVEIQIPLQDSGAKMPAQVVTASISSEAELQSAVEGLRAEMQQNGNSTAETVIIAGEDPSGQTPLEAEHVAEVVKKAGLAKRIARFLKSTPEEKAQASKDYWRTNRHRIILTMVRLGLTTGSSALAIVVTYHAPVLAAIQASIGLGLISASLNYWGTDFYKYVISGDLMTKAYAKRSGIEIRIDEKGHYTDSTLESLATQERRLYYFLTEIVFIGTGAVSRSAAGIQVPDVTFMETLLSNFFSATATVVSQGEWDVQVTRFFERSISQISQELIQNIKSGKYQKSDAELAGLIRDLSAAKWEAISKLEDLDPPLAQKYQTTMNSFQVRLFLGSIVSVSSMIASLSPLPKMGYLGFGFLTAMGYSLRYSLEMNEKLAEWRATGVNPVLSEVVKSMERDLSQIPMVLPAHGSTLTPLQQSRTESDP